MRLIDADRLYNTIIDEVDPISISMDSSEMCGMMRTIIAAEPTVDAVPVKHGRWELVDEAEPQRYGCSKCSCLSWYGMYNYCPNCGAKMDEERSENGNHH